MRDEIVEELRAAGSYRERRTVGSIDAVMSAHGRSKS